MKLGFLYAGQGSQHPGMGADLYEAYPAFRQVLDAAQTALAKKRLFWSRFTALFLAVAVALMAGRVIPAVENTLSRADVTLDHIAIIAQQLEAAVIEEAKAMRAEGE